MNKACVFNGKVGFAALANCVFLSASLSGFCSTPPPASMPASTQVIVIEARQVLLPYTEKQYVDFASLFRHNQAALVSAVQKLNPEQIASEQHEVKANESIRCFHKIVKSYDNPDYPQRISSTSETSTTYRPVVQPDGAIAVEVRDYFDCEAYCYFVGPPGSDINAQHPGSVELGEPVGYSTRETVLHSGISEVESDKQIDPDHHLVTILTATIEAAKQ